MPAELQTESECTMFPMVPPNFNFISKHVDVCDILCVKYQKFAMEIKISTR